MLHERWDHGFSTGSGWMDELHAGITAALQAASDASDAHFCSAYQALVARLELAFRTEESHLDDADPAALKAHREQHARVLRGLHIAHGQVLDGDLALGRRIAEDLLPRWLSFHIVSMDLPLARACKARGRWNSASRLQPV